jgi:DNA polymerase III delta prime subunit
VFENLLAQGEAVSLLSADVDGDCLPPALLFTGPPGSGKLTAALELARAMSCDLAASGGPRAAWNCPCPSCVRHRVLAHADMVIMGKRSFPEEIRAALELLGRSPGKASSFFFVRAARKLARRFDPLLFEGEETRLAKAAPLVREIEEALEALAPERAGTSALAPGAAEAAARAASAAAKLEAFVPEAPPVFMVRNAETWSRLAPLGQRKAVIIENADRMLDSSRNALLKILEEPPETVRYILLSSRKTAIMSTVLSRARIYAFKRRDAAAAALVIEKVFRSAEPASSVDAFLAARRAFPPSAAREHAELYLGAALASRGDAEGLPPPLAALAKTALLEGHSASLALSSLLEATKDFGQRDELYSGSFREFLAALAARFGGILRDPGLGPRGCMLIEGWAALARQARVDNESWNRSAGLLAETLFYAIGDG